MDGAPLNVRRIDVAEGEAISPEAIGRRSVLPPEAMEAAAKIVADVRERGDAALRDCAERFDGWCPRSLRVADDVLDRALGVCDPDLVLAIERARDQIRDFHEREKAESWFSAKRDGTILGVSVRPLASVGIYVPGGRARYPSTVLMNAVPAKVAGVERVVMVTPAQADGTLSAATLAAAWVAGVDEVYAVGGAQAVAALAYGTESVAPVDKICGPGNAYVAAAKRLVSGDVGIDMVAGPSEVCILQDASTSADPLVIAADLAAQAEHDPLAASSLVVYDSRAEGPAAARSSAERLLDEVEAALERILAESPRAAITRASLEDHGLFAICATEEGALGVVNAIAPEHLEVHAENPWGLLGRIRAAGAIFLGPWSSESLGDYVAGPNHTLPTGGTARFRGPLSVADFRTSSSVICYSEAGVADDADATRVLSQAEGLWAHGLSAGLRAEAARGQAVDAIRSLDWVAWPKRLDGEGTVSLAEGA